MSNIKSKFETWRYSWFYQCTARKNSEIEIADSLLWLVRSNLKVPLSLKAFFKFLCACSIDLSVVLATICLVKLTWKLQNIRLIVFSGLLTLPSIYVFFIYNTSEKLLYINTNLDLFPFVIRRKFSIGVILKYVLFLSYRAINLL